MDEQKSTRKDEELIVAREADPELVEAASQIGYINRYMQGVYEVVAEIEKDLPKQFMVITDVLSNNIRHKNAILLGKVRVRQGDPEYKLYLVRKPEPVGRPTLYGEKMKQTAVWLPDPMMTWLKDQPGGISETIRDLVDQAMKK